MTTDRVRLLDVAPRLGAELPRSELADARRLIVVPVVTVPDGHWRCGDLRGLVGACGLGCVVVEGVIAHDLVSGGRVAKHLLGPGDVLAPAVRRGRYLPLLRLFGVTDEARLAVLDESFDAVVRRWPAIARALVAQVEEQMERVAVQQLISQLPRAEQRIVALLWHLADRWGYEEPQGMVLPLTLSHEAISRLVGGRRSTVSAALGTLAGAGLVTRLANDTWLLTPASRELLEPSATPPRPPSIRLLGAGSRR
jgi:hypothetical protein